MSLQTLTEAIMVTHDQERGTAPVSNLTVSSETFFGLLPTKNLPRWFHFKQPDNLNVLKVPRLGLPTDLSHPRCTMFFCQHVSIFSVQLGQTLATPTTRSSRLNPTVVLDGPGTTAPSHLGGCLPLLTTTPNYGIPLQDTGRKV